ncbi:MAG: SdrD B-like domain-containing protein [Bacteroidota bacterium]
MVVVNNLLILSDFENFVSYDGARLRSIKDPLWQNPSSSDRIMAMSSFNGELIAAGRDGSTWPVRTYYLARYDGASWHFISMPTDTVAFEIIEEINGKLYFTGAQIVRGDYVRSKIPGYRMYSNLVFDGSKWSPLRPFVANSFFEGGYLDYGNDIYVSGDFLDTCTNLGGGVLKLCDLESCKSISGHVFRDLNNNCAQDSGETNIAQQWVSVQPGNYLAQTDINGNYFFTLDSGSYTVNLLNVPFFQSNICNPNGYTVKLDTINSNATGIDFPLFQPSSYDDLSLVISPPRFRPGFDARIHLQYENKGTDPQNARVELILDSLISYNNFSSLSPDTAKGDTLVWDLGIFQPGTTGRLWLEVNTPTTANFTDTVKLLGTIFPILGDTIPGNNIDTTFTPVTGSFDPNDKQVFPTGDGPEGNVPPETKTLTYKIRFQNTGTDTAFFVIIRDEISSLLDLSTLKTIASSHPFSFQVDRNQRVGWRFDDILLPDSSTNEPASHGFVTFTINLRDSLPIGTQITNRAAIYFDFNMPIITNKTKTTLFVEPPFFGLTGHVFQDINNNCIQDPGEANISEQWVSIEPGNHIVLTDDNGDFTLPADSGTYTINLVNLPSYWSNTCQNTGYTVTLDSTNTSATELDFALSPVPNVNDLFVRVSPPSFVPGADSRMYLNYENIGTESLSSRVELVLDPLVTLNSASPSVTSIQGDTLAWDVGLLTPMEKGRIWVDINTPLTAQVTDTIRLEASISPFVGDSVASDNRDTTFTPVSTIAESDDKQVFPKGNGPNGNIPPETQQLTFTIRFQNTGTTPVSAVQIKDELDSTLTLTTLKTIASSHPYTFTVEENQRVSWRFDNILLSDIGSNEPASHGFVTFRIDLKENLPVGTQITNTADIYLDNAQPLITNTTQNTLFEEIVSIDMGKTSSLLTIWPQPAEEWMNLSMNQYLQNAAVVLYDLQGRQVARYTELSGEQIKVPTRDLLPGMYLLKIADGTGQQAAAKVVVR